jgi:hypothetical protein
MAAVFVSNLVINAGATFAQEFTLTQSDDSGPINVSDFTITAQLRKHGGSTKKVEFTTNKVNASQGRIQISLTPSQTVPTAIKPGRYLYDIILTDGAGDKTRVVEGAALIREGVTR